MISNQCDIHRSKTEEEQKAHGTKAFPVAAYLVHHGCAPENDIPWHWHAEFEIIYSPKGKMEIQIPDRQVMLSGENLFLINSNVLHYGRAIEPSDLESLVFSGRLAAGEEDSAFAMKYIAPLSSCIDFRGLFIDGLSHPDLITDFKNAMDAMQREAFGYEFTVREALSHILLYAAEVYRPRFSKDGLSGNSDDFRMQQMLRFIEQHYSERLELQDIAGAASISGRECQRLFKRTIRTTPVQYLTKYRIERGAGMLDDRTMAIAQISSRCGIESPSNFSSLFKRYYACTPQEYRKRKVNR